MRSLRYYIRHGDPGDSTIDFVLGMLLWWRTWLLMVGLGAVIVGLGYAVSVFQLNGYAGALLGLVVGVWFGQWEPLEAG